MNNYLILSEELLLVSDETAGINDYALYGGKITKKLVEADWSNDEKIIAGIPSLPTITFSEEAYQQMKERFGWVDLEREADNNGMYDEQEKGFFKSGLETYKSLNKKRFSEEDMFLIFKKGIEWMNTQFESGGRYGEGWSYDDDFGTTIKSLSQPKRVKVEVEMEKVCNYPKCDCDLGCCGSADFKNKVDGIKITNKTIKITRLC